MTGTIALNKLCLILNPDTSLKLSRLRDAGLSGGLLPGEIAVLEDSAMNVILPRAEIPLLFAALSIQGKSQSECQKNFPIPLTFALDGISAPGFISF